jgi:transposase InsO family protein
MDVWGPYKSPSYHHHKYFLTILDDYSRHIWVIFLKHKSETHYHITNFLNMVSTQFGKSVKMIRTDNGTEFFLRSLFHSKGILHQTSCVETPQQNGRVERRHQHILNVARALLFQARLPS